MSISRDQCLAPSSSVSRSSSCHLHSIQVEYPEDDLVSSNSVDHILTMHSMPSVQDRLEELAHVEHEERRLKRDLEANAVQFKREEAQLLKLIADHQVHTKASMHQRIHSADKQLEEAVVSQLKMESERQLAQSDRKNNFMEEIKYSEQSAALSAALELKQRKLLSLWQQSIQPGSSLLHQSLVNESVTSVRSAVRSCAKKNALAVTRATAQLEFLTEQWAVYLQKRRIIEDAFQRGLKVVVSVREIIPNQALLSKSEWKDLLVNNTRGYGIEMDSRKGSVTLNTPKGEVFFNFPSTSFNIEEKGSHPALFAEHIIPFLRGCCEAKENGVVFSLGDVSSGKAQFLFGSAEPKKDADTSNSMVEDSRVASAPEQRQIFCGLTEVTKADLSLHSSEQECYPTGRNYNGVISDAVDWLLHRRAALDESIVSLHFSMYEVFDDRIFDLLDWIPEVVEDTKDMKYRDKLAAKERVVMPKELSVTQSRQANQSELSWDVKNAKCISIETSEAATEAIHNAYSQISKYRKSDADWSSVCVDVRINFRCSEKFTPSTFLPRGGSVLHQALLKNPRSPGESHPAVRIVFCKLPNCQRPPETEKNYRVIGAAKKCLGSLTDVMAALHKSGSATRSVEELEVGKPMKSYNAAALRGTNVSLSKSQPILQDVELTERNLFGAPITRHGHLIKMNTSYLAKSSGVQESCFVPYRNSRLTQVLQSCLTRLTSHLFFGNLTPCCALETPMPDLPATEDAFLQECAVRYGQKAPEIIISAKYTLQYLKSLS